MLTSLTESNLCAFMVVETVMKNGRKIKKKICPLEREQNRRYCLMITKGNSHIICSVFFRRIRDNKERKVFFTLHINYKKKKRRKGNIVYRKIYV